MNEKLLEKYAVLAVKVGINLQKGQSLRISCPIEAADFGRLCQSVAYQAGARKVLLDYRDELARKTELELATQEALCEFPNYKAQEMHYLIDENVAVLNIYAETPGLLKAIDPDKLQAVAISNSQNYKPWQEHTMANKVQWCVISFPTVGWAKKVFPHLAEQQAVDQLLAAILQTVRVDNESDPQENWIIHNANLKRRTELLNNYSFEYLTFQSANGTDLKLYLAENHHWAGGSEETSKGLPFNANLPSEECFTMPFKSKVTGKVVATKPLNYQGKLIEDFYLVFQDGKVVDFDARSQKDTLANLLSFDEGSAYLGEVALISHDSPIANTNILFYNTLFDENASCHLALGSAYPMNIKGFEALSEEQLIKQGYNKSLQHEDFMFGAADLEVFGHTKSGEAIAIFKDGNFVF